MKNIYILLVIFIASCSSSDKKFHSSQQGSDNIYTLSVSRLEFIYPNQPKIEYPHFEYLLPQQLPDIVTNWFNKHINITKSGDLIVKITIKEATAIEIDGNSLEDHEEYSTKNNNLYKLSLITRLEIVNKHNPEQVLDYIDSTILKTVLVNKELPSEEYDDVFLDLTNKVILEFNQQMLESIPLYFKNILTN